MLTGRTAKIVWSFLIGVTAAEGAALAWVFWPAGNWLLSAVHYAATPTGTPLAWCLSACVASAYIAHAARRSPVIRRYAFRPRSWGPFAGVRLLAVVMAVVTGFFEEVMFRRAGMDLAMRHGYGSALQILFSAVAFGLVHAVWGLFGGHVRAAASAMLATGTLGGLLAIVYIIGDRSVAPCVAAHILINVTLEPWLILTSASASWGKRSVSL